MDEQLTPEQRISNLLGAEETPEAEEAQPEATEQPQEALEQEPEPEAPSEEEAPQETAQDASEGDEDDIPTVESLTDLAEHLGVEVADLYNLRVPVTTADGERADVSLSEWKDGYQQKSRLQKAQQEAEELRESLRAQHEKAQEQADAYAQQASAAIELANTQLMQEFQGIDWNRLQAENPAEWAVKRQQFAERKVQIDAAFQQAQQSFQLARQEQAQRREAEMSKLLAKEQQALNEAMSDLKDEASRKAEMSKIAKYMESLGFQEHEIGGLVDHRTAIAFRKAMLFDEQQKKGDAARKRIKIGQGKVLKPGARQSKEAQAKERVSQARARVRKTGKVDDAAAAISQLLK